MNRIWLLALLAVLGTDLCCAADHWVVRFQHEETGSTLTLTDLAFPTPKRGIACGFEVRHASGLLGDREIERGVVLVTSDGGSRWSRVTVKESPISLFFLNESTGWMVTSSGVWLTEEGGREWKRIGQIRDVDRVLFLTREHGFAIGPLKHVFESKDAGVSWTAVSAAATPDTTKEWTVYSSISFVDGLSGLITGTSHPPQKISNQEALVEPKRLERQREVPHVGIFLDTKDGGKTWTSSTGSLFGDITRTSLSSRGYGLGLVEFRGVFPWPSEVYKITLKGGSSERVYREHDRSITDVLIVPGGDAFLAGYEPPGKINPSPIPGKVKILRSSDLENWTEMPVDYRAVGARVVLASPGGSDVWAATDTGTILHLEPEKDK